MSATGLLMIVLGVWVIARLVTKDDNNQNLAGRLTGHESTAAAAAAPSMSSMASGSSGSAGAVGTFTPAAGTNYTQGQEPTLSALLELLSGELGVGVTGISGYRSPAHSVAVGGYADDPHTLGEASDTGLATGPLTYQNVTNQQLADVGLWRPFDLDGSNPAEADHLQILPQLGGPAVPGETPPQVSQSVLQRIESHLGLS